MPQTPTFDEWKEACIKKSEELGLTVGDMWEEGDPYDLFNEAERYFKDGADPVIFLEEIFEEDLARRAGDDEESLNSLREGAELAEEFDDED
jgi:hypothetical protein